MVKRMVLFIDACARPQSRTRMLAEAVCEMTANKIERLDLFRQDLPPLDSEWWHFVLKDEPYPETYFEFPVSSQYLKKA